MTDALLFAVATLASYRVWRLVAKDDWPPIARIRDRILWRWERKEPNDERYTWKNGLECPWCLGTLITFAFWGGLAQVRSIPLPAIVALASASLVGLIGAIDE